jgi:hypothetical protein
LLEVLEGRHPLAVGHMINHPAPGKFLITR